MGLILSALFRGDEGSWALGDSEGRHPLVVSSNSSELPKPLDSNIINKEALVAMEKSMCPNEANGAYVGRPIKRTEVPLRHR